ncbi:hypothetical protein [Hymenobacter negativus]|uniref:Uncharacterized protein n=1 Tax=Hymenobacter negativus TaxID=2795026 RepID=A0ABS3QDI2_9BACT|nr:hypothetical protein [Hymenobacter negativus]MBO2009063.1 hypothetical protein [Hymenobacter negativus]
MLSAASSTSTTAVNQITYVVEVLLAALSMTFFFLLSKQPDNQQKCASIASNTCLTKGLATLQTG